MNLFCGVFGPNSQKYKYAFEKFDDHDLIHCNAGILLNVNEGPLKVEPVVSHNSKSILLNGLFVLSDYTWDDVLANSSILLQNIVQKKPEQVPLEFSNGAFIGALVDDRTIYLFNDFMGLAPLYYSIQEDTLFFSNSLLFWAKVLQPDWDPEAISEFLHLGYNLSYRTVFENLYCLKPATLLTFSEGTMTQTHYFTFPQEPERTSSVAEALDIIHTEFQQALKRLYSPDLTYCLSMTGGMDTRLLFLEWPDRTHLMTQTAGEGTSDHLKAKELVRRLGNVSLYELENLYESKFVEGIQKFYEACDDPTRTASDYNYYHLAWKRNRGADIHLTGVLGELYNGENLYLNRSPFYLLKEAVIPYSYHSLDNSLKPRMIGQVLYAQYKKALAGVLQSGFQAADPTLLLEQINQELDYYVGQPAFNETYIERIRTFYLAALIYYPLEVGSTTKDLNVFPYIDRKLVTAICNYHPATRELRRMQIAALKKYDQVHDIPIDTSHLKITYPYFIHKLMRVPRMVLNIGLHRKVPFLQQGTPPLFRASKYFDHTETDYREYIKSTILACSFYDKKRVQAYLDEVDKVERFTFFTHHREDTNIKILFRLALTEQKSKH